VSVRVETSLSKYLLVSGGVGCVASRCSSGSGGGRGHVLVRQGNGRAEGSTDFRVCTTAVYFILPLSDYPFADQHKPCHNHSPPSWPSPTILSRAQARNHYLLYLLLAQGKEPLLSKTMSTKKVKNEAPDDTTACSTIATKQRAQHPQQQQQQQQQQRAWRSGPGRDGH